MDSSSTAGVAGSLAVLEDEKDRVETSFIRSTTVPSENPKASRRKLYRSLQVLDTMFYWNGSPPVPWCRRCGQSLANSHSPSPRTNCARKSCPCFGDRQSSLLVPFPRASWCTPWIMEAGSRTLLLVTLKVGDLPRESML